MRHVPTLFRWLPWLALVAGSPAIAEFTFEVEGVRRPPPAALPGPRMQLQAFEGRNAIRAFLPRVEPIESMERLPGERQALFTKTWRVEPHRAEGALLITRTDEPPLAPKTVDIPRLERESVARLQRLGIPSTEIGAVATRRLFSADNDGRAVDAPTLQRYKTFVRRELNGIPVEGHRAVVTHGPGGDFVRANMLWPAIAREGHVATTRMRTPEIVRLAESALRKEGEETGAVKLNWKYVPVKRANGEVVLHLAVAAHIQPKSEKGTEPREVTVLLSND